MNYTVDKKTAAQLCGVSTRTISMWAADGKIEFSRGTRGKMLIDTACLPKRRKPTNGQLDAAIEEAEDCAMLTGECHYVVGNSKMDNYFVVNSVLFDAKGRGVIDFVAFPRRG